MRNLWHRLLIKLGLRQKPKVLKASNVEISIIGRDGKRVVIGAFRTSIWYGPLFVDEKDTYQLPSGDKMHISGRGEFKQEAALFRERHCAVCLQAPSPCCGKPRNTAHAEGCTHVCTHSYQRFAP